MCVLEEKVATLRRQGVRVMIVTQFCFDPKALVTWLKRTIERLRVVEASVAEELEAKGQGADSFNDDPFKRGAKGSNSMCFHIGIPGPTKKSKLERIARICEVSSKFLVSIFDLLDADHDGKLTLSELKEAAGEILDVPADVVSGLFAKHDVHNTGTLSRHQFADLLAEVAEQSSSVNVNVNVNGASTTGGAPSTDSNSTNANAEHQEQPQQPQSLSHSHSGPSALLEEEPQQPQQQHSGPSALLVEEPMSNPGMDATGAAQVTDGDTDVVVYPIDLIEAVAAFCEHEHINAEAIHTHFYPFGGIAATVKLVNDLRSGSWPPLLVDAPSAAA
jgi:Ca2+-binding EF-hand superfamily protein